MLFLVMASGCSFSVDVAPGDGRAADGPAVDVAPDVTVAPFCDSAGDPTLVGCWEMEGAATDASGDGHDASASLVSFTPGKQGLAANLTASSSLFVGPHAALGPAHLSIEAWIRLASLPASGRVAVIDNDSAYGVFVTATTVSCVTTASATAVVTLPLETWTHVACTHDGFNVKLFLDGAVVATTAALGAAGPGNVSGAVLGGNSPTGDRMIGLLDQMRVFTEPRSAAQICAAAERATCP